MAHHAVIVDNSVCAQNFAGAAGGFPRHPHIVHFQHRNVRGMHAAGVLQAADLQRQELRFGDFGDHPDQFFLHQLVRGDRLVVELLAFFGVTQRGVVAGHGRADAAPANAVAGLIQAGQRAAQTFHAGENIFRGNFAIGHGKAGGDRSAQRIFSMHVPSFKAGRTFFHQEAANFSIFAFRPNERDGGQRAAGDPHFFAVQDVLVALLHRTGQHAARIGAELRFGESETPNRFALLQQGQPLVFLRVGTKGINRIHHQRRLNGDEAAQPRIAALQFLSHQAVFDVGHARAAVTFEARAKQAQFRHLRNQLHREFPFAIVFLDDRHYLVVDELPRGVARQFFFVAENGIEVEIVDSGK